MSLTQTYYQGKTGILATKHKKEQVIAPILEQTLGLKLVVPEDFDSDQFGTFTGETPRQGSQLDAARRKARAAMERYGYSIGVASEGAFGSNPEAPWLSSNLELVLLVDTELGIEVRGHHRTSETNAQKRLVKNLSEALAFAQAVGFPHHGIVVRKAERDTKHLHKDITSYEALERVVEKMLRKWWIKEILLETDLRAHMNPTRMQAIKRATEDLVENILRTCPACGCPGYAVAQTKKGLPCETCGRPTELARAVIYECQKCHSRSEQPLEKKAAPTRMCDFCNP